MTKIWSDNAINIYKALYFDTTETKPEQTHHRVAKFIAGDDSRIYDIYLNLLNNDIFRPNTPCMINSRLIDNDFEVHDKNLVACFVLGLEDNMKSIIDMWGTCATVYAGGGGTGIPLSNLREAGASISAGGQACLTGDTILYNDDPQRAIIKQERTIKDLYLLQAIDKKRLSKIRCMIDGGIIGVNSIINIIHNGISDVYEIETKLGYKIKATKDHRFLGYDGTWYPLEQFYIGSAIAVNGRYIGNCIKCNKNKLLNGTLSKFPDVCNPCSQSLYTGANQRTQPIGPCIRCGRISKLTSQYANNPGVCPACNTSIRKGYNIFGSDEYKNAKLEQAKKHSELMNNPIIKERMRLLNLGENNPMWKGDNCSKNSARQRLNALYPELSKIAECQRCNVSGIRIERHHKDGNVYNSDLSNIEILCVACHQKEEAHRRAINSGDPRRIKEIIFDEIINITYVGKEEVYDIQMAPPYHNFIANGFVSHNSGPLIYLKTIQNISETVKSGGKSRRAANLASFWYQHPDILEFITCKNGNDFNAVNISVLVDDFFMTHVYNNTLDREIDLISPNKNKVIKQIPIGKIWDSIIDNAWNNGDPGLLFKTTANKYNPMKSLGEMTVSNPCLPSWAPVLTSNGYKHFIDIGNEICLNGESLTCSNIFETGKNRTVYKIKLESGLALYATEEHGIYTSSGKIELKNITLNTEIEMDYTPIQFKLDIEEYALGLEYIKVYPEIKNISVDLLKDPISYQLGFIDGIISYSNNIEIKETIKFKFLTNIDLIIGVQLILSSVGIYSEIDESHHLNIIDIEQFKNIFNITSEEKSNIINNLKFPNSEYIKKLKKYQKPESINKLESTETVYDITVPERHKFVSSGCVISNCGEVLLPDNFCCNLGSINLNKCLDYNSDLLEYSFNWETFKTYISHSVRFLDSVIDKTSYPSKKFEDNMKLARPIGLGLMGWADILFKLKIRYGSINSIDLFSKICKFLTCEAFKTSLDIAKTLGSISFNSEDYTNFINLLEYYGLEEEDINIFKETGIRNCTVTSVAPTGSVSISASCSYSFEPSMALIWEKELIDRNIKLKFFNQQFKNECEIRNIELTDDVISQIINNKGSIQKLNFPNEMKEVFVVAHDINYKDKIEMQSVGQRYITLGMSSTCNLPKSATKEDVSEIFKLAWKKNLKGITVYRDGTQSSQPIGFGKNEELIIDPIKLPNKRPGNTIKVETPNGSLYVICNKVNGKIAEMFLLMGTLGKLEFLLINTLSKIISKSLQYRVPIDVILNQMQEIGTDKFWFKLDEEKNYMTSAESIIDAIAKIIRYHFNDETVDGYKLINDEVVCNLLNEKISDNYQYCPICKRKTLALNVGCRGGICQNPKCCFTSCG